MGLNIEEIEQGSIRIVNREETKVSLQCLKEDIGKLPVEGIASGSDCLILDALETENNYYVYNKVTKKAGKWYAI